MAATEPGNGRWFDEEAGPIVRPYVLTADRSAPDLPGLDLTTLVRSVLPREDIRHASGLTPEQYEIIDICVDWCAIVDIAKALPANPQAPAEEVLAFHAASIDGFLGLPIAVVRVLVSDLHREGFVQTSEPSPQDLHNAALYRVLLEALRAL